MEAAYMGSAKASIRSTSAPRSTMLSTGDIILIISGAKTNIMAPATVISTMPMAVER